MSKRFSRLTTKRSFTLIELVVTTAIFGILVVGIGQFLSSFLTMKFNAETLQRMRQEGNYALDQIDYLVRNGLTIPDICVGRIIPENPPEDPSGGSRFTVYNIDGLPLRAGETCQSRALVNPYTLGQLQPQICEMNPDPAQISPPPLGSIGQYSSEFYEAMEICGSDNANCHTFGELRTNTQGDTDDLYFVRNLVTLATYDGTNYDTEEPTEPVSSDPDDGFTGGSLYLFRTRDATTKHLAKDDFVGLVNSGRVNAIALTNFRTGTGGDVPFTVSNFRTFCFFDYFTNGYVVNTSFDISYKRRTLSGRLDNSLPVISERFRRSTVVRNPYPFEY